MEEKRPFAEADQSAVGCSHGRWRYTQRQMSARVLALPRMPSCRPRPIDVVNSLVAADTPLRGSREFGSDSVDDVQAPGAACTPQSASSP